MDDNKRMWRISRLDAQILVTVLAVALAALALYVAWRNDQRTEIVVNEDVTNEEATAILERANDAVAFADSILSFLEGASVVVGAGLAIGAWMLRNSIQSQIETTRDFVQQTEARFAEREQELTALETDLKQRLDTLVTFTEQQLAGAKDEARASFRVLSLLVLAEQQVRDHNLNTALRTLEEAYVADADNQATNYLLGYLYTSRKQFDVAIERLERALELDPGFAPAQAALGLALRRKGDGTHDDPTEQARLWAMAEAKLLEALGRDPHLTDADGESYFGTLGGLYRRQNRFDDALRVYDEARRVTPNSSYPITNLAALHKRLGHDDQATFFFERVVRAAELQLDDDPRDYWTRADYAQAKLVLGDVASAVAELRTVIDSVQEYGLLESVRSGLAFLAQSPTSIEGLDEMLALVNTALSTREQQPSQNQDAVDTV
ncbi:MAG: tetratricopeptide repeat protein [Chloroflexi bacterium]|nr:tetratricopeptide repeat protein [Chloroflexota bacterium]